MNEQIKQRITQLNNGEVPVGYKKTEIGVFPSDWKNAKLGQISKMCGGGTPDTKKHEYWRGDIPWISSSDLIEDKLFQAHISRYVSKEAIINSATKLCPKDSIAVVTRVGLGKIALINVPFCTSQDFTNIIESSCDKRYLVYQIKNAINAKIRECQGTSIKGITVSDLQKVEINYPLNKEEQSKIAEILMKWDEAIELREKHIAALESKKEAILQRLVVKNDGWKKVKLKDILIERSIFATKEDGYPHVTLSKAGVNKKTDRYNRDFLVKSDDKKYKITYPNDICYNPANLKFGVICVNKFPEEAIFSPIYVTYEVSKEYNVDFIGAILCSNNFINYIRKYEEGSVYERQAVKSEDFLRGEMWVPSSKAEQDRIADVIHKINDYINLVQQELETLQLQRKTLQQYLLNGIVRVK